MTSPLLPAFLIGALCATAAILPSPQEEPPKMPSPQDMAAMMEKAKKFTQPGDAHKLLEKMLGKWDYEIRMFMGGQATPPEKGTSETTWLMDGRWIRTSWSGTMMRMPTQGFMLMGYDNFKMSYVVTMVSSMDTAMNHAEGDLTQDGKTLIVYGTLDEYLTGEHDKMVKYVWRFESADRVVFEVHDLPIGETGTKVVEVAYTRAK